jgi:predicted transcriptional regulator
MMAERDFLDELVEERTARNPEFPRLLEAAEQRRKLLRTLAEKREEQQRTQTEVAAVMHSSQSSVARLEGAASDVRLSTIQRYADAIGFQIQLHLVPLEEASVDSSVIVHR